MSEIISPLIRRPSHTPAIAGPQEWIPSAYSRDPSAADSAESFRYGILLRRHRPALLAICAVCLGISLLVTFLMPPAYKSKILLEVMQMNPEFMNGKDIDPNGAPGAADAYMETQTKLLASSTLSDRVVAALAPKVRDSQYEQAGGIAKIRQLLGLQPSPLKSPDSVIREAIGSMKVKAEGQSNLISVSLLGPTAQLAADTANSLGEQYIDASQEARWNSAARTGEFLRKQLDGLRVKLQSSENELQNYAHQTGLIYTSDGTRQSVSEEKLREIQIDVEKAQADLAEKQSQLELLKSSDADALPQVLDDSSLRENRSRIADLKRQKADLESTLTPHNYKVKQVDSQIAELEAQQEHQRAAVIQRIRNDYSAVARREELLNRRYQTQLALLSDQSSKGVRYNMLRHEVDANRELYQSLLQKVREAGVNAALRASNVRIVDPATKSLTPSQPNLLVNVAIGALAALLSSLLYILITERRDQSIRVPGETVRLLDIPELATIPVARGRIRGEIPQESSNSGFRRKNPGQLLETTQTLLTKWTVTDSLIAEAFRSAVTSILMWAGDGAVHRVIVVTSAHPKAGKTTSVFNLGVGLAESGQRVLLIDGDMRRPRLGRMFGFEQSDGLSDTLQAGPAPGAVKDLIRETTMPGLFVLPSGSIRPNVPQLLHSSRLHSVINQFRSEFDFVLIDSPPSGPLNDARLLAKHADGVILICRAGETMVDQIMAVRKCFTQDGTRVIGSILNGWNARAEDPAYLETYANYARISASR